MRYFIFIFLLSTLSCSSGSDPASSNSNSDSSVLDPDKRILASNVLFINEAQAQEQDDIDTHTKVLAKNVILDSKDLSLTSEDLQTAFETVVAPRLTETLIGTWQIINATVRGGYVYNTGSDTTGYTTDGGTITFNTDSTFVLENTPEDIKDMYDTLLYMPWVMQRDDAVVDRKYEYQVISDKVFSLKTSATAYTTCSSNECAESEYNDGDQCTCGGVLYQAATCYGSCINFVSEPYNVYNITPATVNWTTENSLTIEMGIFVSIFTRI